MATASTHIRKAAMTAASVALALVLCCTFGLPLPAAYADGSETSGGASGASGQATQSGSFVSEQAAYANALISTKASEVQRVTARANDTLVLAGDFQGGWGTVTFTWAAAEGSVSQGRIVLAGMEPSVAEASGAATEADGKEGAFIFEQDYAQPAGGTDQAVWPQSSVAVDSGSFSWRVLGSVSLHESLPNLNRAVVPGGLSQTIELSDLKAGRYGLRLTAQDEVGDAESIYWDVNVQEADGTTAEADTNFHLLLNPTQADLDNNGGTGTNANGGQGDDYTAPAVFRIPAEQSQADLKESTLAAKSAFPQTGDPIRLVALAASSIAMLAVLAVLFSRLMANRKRK